MSVVHNDEDLAEMMRSTLDAPDVIAEAMMSAIENSVARNVFGDPIVNDALWHQVTGPDDLKADGVTERAEGAEYPMVRVSPPRLDPLVTTDVGGKFAVTDEQVERGVFDAMSSGVTAVQIEIQRWLDRLTISALDGAAGSTDHGIMAGNDWGSFLLDGADPTPPRERPTADLALARLALRLDGFGAQGDVLVLHPSQLTDLTIGYGDRLGGVLDDAGLTAVSSTQVEAGTGYIIESGSLGGLVTRKPLTVETIPDRHHRQTFVQTYCEPGVYISRPQNVVRLTGLAG